MPQGPEPGRAVHTRPGMRDSFPGHEGSQAAVGQAMIHPFLCNLEVRLHRPVVGNPHLSRCRNQEPEEPSLEPSTPPFHGTVHGSVSGQGSFVPDLSYFLLTRALSLTDALVVDSFSRSEVSAASLPSLWDQRPRSTVDSAEATCRPPSLDESLRGSQLRLAVAPCTSIRVAPLSTTFPDEKIAAGVSDSCGPPSRYTDTGREFPCRSPRWCSIKPDPGHRRIPSPIGNLPPCEAADRCMDACTRKVRTGSRDRLRR